MNYIIPVYDKMQANCNSISIILLTANRKGQENCSSISIILFTANGKGIANCNSISIILLTVNGGLGLKPSGHKPSYLQLMVKELQIVTVYL